MSINNSVKAPECVIRRSGRLITKRSFLLPTAAPVDRSNYRGTPDRLVYIEGLAANKKCAVGHSSIENSGFGVFATVDICDEGDANSHNIQICEYKMKKNDKFLNNSKYYVDASGLQIDAHVLKSCTGRYLNDSLKCNLDNCQ